MTEGFKERFFGGLRNLVGNPRSKNELTSGEYLASLSEVDRVKVVGFCDFIRNPDRWIGAGLAVTAVGSTVSQEAERTDLPRDIDLRVLNTALTGSQERVAAIARIRDAVTSYFRGKRIPFTEKDCTYSTRMVRGTSDGKKVLLLPFVDWYNDDPSVVANYPEGGLPLHVSVSGPDNYAMRKYLRKERRHNSRFALLCQTQYHP